ACERHGHERAHGVTHHEHAIHAEPVEHGGEIRRMRGEACRARQVAAAPAAAQIGGDEPHLGKRCGHLLPRQVRRGDPVHQQHRGRRLRADRGLPYADLEIAAGDGDGDGVPPGCQCHRAVHPPSIVYDAPVTIPAASEASQPASEATSSASTRRLIALSVSMTFSTPSVPGSPCPAAWSAICSSTSGVPTWAGLMQLLVPPWGPPSRAVPFDSPSMACLAVTYATLY